MPILVLSALLAAASPPPPPGKETVIPFVHSRGVLDWQAAGDTALYVRGYDGRWYFVRTSNLCPRLRDALSLGFAVSANDQLDRYGAILAQGMRCPIASIIVAAAPPPKTHRR